MKTFMTFNGSITEGGGKNTIIFVLHILIVSILNGVTLNTFCSVVTAALLTTQDIFTFR